MSSPTLHESKMRNIGIIPSVGRAARIAARPIGVLLHATAAKSHCPGSHGGCAVFTLARLQSTVATQVEDEPAPIPSVRPNELLEVGHVIEGWSVIACEKMETFGVHVITLKHSSGAAYVHLDCEDSHRFASVNFRTPVDNHRGAPHILEHTTLCGSARYDVKDPFHLMTSRSLHTDMNATTSSTVTTYHFSTQNETDFYNLLSVYLDAAFFPKLRKDDFEQEGHRTEPFEPSDPKSRLVIRGVVYNEMKGYFSGASEHITRSVLENLLPGTPYAFSHGGDPRHIPDLTHKQLVEFHAAHYTPSNALFVTYGNIELGSMLRAVNSSVMSIAVTPPIKSRARVLLSKAAGPAPGPKMRRVRVPPDGYALLDPKASSGGLNGKIQGHMNESALLGSATTESVAGALGAGNGAGQRQSSDVVEGAHPNCTYLRAWAVGDARDISSTLLMRVMLDLLSYGTESPLYHFLVRPGLASSVSGNTGFDSSTLQPVLILGATGIQEGSAKAVDDAIEQAIRFTIDPVGYKQATAGGGVHAGVHPSDPFTPIRIRAVLHGIEITLRTRTPSFGAFVAGCVTDHWALGEEPEGSALATPLRVEDCLVELRLQLGISEDGKFDPAPGEPEVSAPAVPAGQSGETQAAVSLRAALRRATVDNMHAIRLLAVPDETLLDEMDGIEAGRLVKAEKKWTDKKRTAAVRRSQATDKRRQSSAEDAAKCLPYLPVSAVSRTSPMQENISYRFLEASPQFDMKAVENAPMSMCPTPVPLQIVSEPTNGLATLRIIFGMQLPDIVSRTGMVSAGEGLAVQRHPWYDLQSSGPLSGALLKLPDPLHAWLPLATSFTGFGTKERAPSQWEVDSRLALGRLGASLVTATPTVLPRDTGTAIPIPPGLARVGALSMYPDFLEGATLTPPLYAIALELSWLADVPHTKRMMELVGELLAQSAVADGSLRNRDRALFADTLRSAAVDAAMGVGDCAEGYARRWSAAGLHPLAALAELQGGISQARLYKAIAQAGEAGIDAAADACRTIVRSVLQRPFVPRLAVADLVKLEANVEKEMISLQLNSVNSTGFPIRAMLTCEPSLTKAVSFGAAAHGAPLRSMATQDLLTAAAEFVLGCIPLQQVTDPGRSGSTGAGRVSVLRAGPALPSSLRIVDSGAPTLPKGIVPMTATGQAQVPSQRTLLHIPGSKVSTLALSMPGPSWGTPDHVHMHLACTILCAGHLHEAVRERGGAYDVFARVGSIDDILISTGEDPTPVGSLALIRAAVDSLATGEFTEQEVEEAKLCMFAELDSPVGPEGRGLSVFLYGVTGAARQAYRDKVFAATHGDVVAAARAWLKQPLDVGAYAVTLAGATQDLKSQLGQAHSQASNLKGKGNAEEKVEGLAKGKGKASKPKAKGNVNEVARAEGASAEAGTEGSVVTSPAAAAKVSKPQRKGKGNATAGPAAADGAALGLPPKPSAVADVLPGNWRTLEVFA